MRSLPHSDQAASQASSLLSRYGKDHTERVPRALDAIRSGRMVVLVDDEDRENEGDLVMAADATQAQDINFMAKEGRGLICVTLTPQRLAQFNLPMMVEENQSGYGTAFTVSIEAKTGVTTGISAADRARTIQVVMDDEATPDDLVKPGHVFPLRAQPGGVLVRTGQTEGSVDLARLAGFRPAGVICEILNDDGTMARLPDLIQFATKHDLVIVSVADLIAYRLENERFITLSEPVDIQTPYGHFEVCSATSAVNSDEALVFRTKHWDASATALVRVHSGDAFEDIFGGVLSRFGFDLGPVLEKLNASAAGVLLYIPPKPKPMRFTEELERLRATLQADGVLPKKKRGPVGASPVMRQYGMGAQILKAIGLSKITIMTNSTIRLPGASGFGIDIVGTTPMPDLEPIQDTRK